jgi:hypothetical protein
LQTTTGLVKVPRNLLKKQFTDPRLIAESELSALISHFKKS